MTNYQLARRSYLKDNKGTIAPMFGLLAIPMLAITGAAIDIGKAITAEKNMQNALDAAAVAACGGGTGQQTTEEILRAFMAAELDGTGMNLAPPADPNAPVADIAEYEIELMDGDFTADGSLNPKVKTTIPTSILKLLGINSIDLEAQSAVKCGAKRLELSVVVDVTGSMNWYAGGRKKIDSMKDAATDLLDIFERNMDAGVTKIGLVPFSESVRLPSSLLPLVRDYPSRTYRFKKNGGGNKWRTYELTDCVTERNGNHRFTDDAPGPGRWINPMYSDDGDCRPSQTLMPMTTNHAELQSVIDNLSPAGGTAGHLGTAWGWYMLSPNWQSVWPEASQPEVVNDDELIKATIIMTDGDYNTEYCHGVNDSVINCNSPNGTSQAQAEELCANMKEAGVVVYTIGFGISSGSSQETLLKGCATDDTKWFFPYDGDQLRAAFQTIGKQLSGGQAGKAIVQQ
ncbi:MAG: hypothetical protein KJ622_05615 [Alphaproteobacteria bacterium]|nr:hypothetical protein [Alphaproteobacteria bacterium]